MITLQEQALLDWYHETWAYRTENRNDDINWVDPEYRITWTEVLAKADQLGALTGMNAVDRRLRWDELLKESKR